MPDLGVEAERRLDGIALEPPVEELARAFCRELPQVALGAARQEREPTAQGEGAMMMPAPWCGCACVPGAQVKSGSSASARFMRSEPEAHFQRAMRSRNSGARCLAPTRSR